MAAASVVGSVVAESALTGISSLGGGGSFSRPAIPGTISNVTDAVSLQAILPTKTALYSETIINCTPNGDPGYHSKSGQDEAIFKIYRTNPYRCGGVVVEISDGDGKEFNSSYFFEVSSNICYARFVCIYRWCH